MSLIKCVQCKREISSRAQVCPHCGDPDPQVAEPVAEPAESGLFKVLFWLFWWLPQSTKSWVKKKNRESSKAMAGMTLAAPEPVDVEPPKNLVLDALIRGVVALISCLLSIWLFFLVSGITATFSGIALLWIPFAIFPLVAYLHICAAIMQVISNTHVTFAGFEKTFNSWKGWQKILASVLIMTGLVTGFVVGVIIMVSHF